MPLTSTISSQISSPITRIIKITITITITTTKTSSHLRIAKMTDVRIIQSQADFDELTSSNHHVLVEFFAPSQAAYTIAESKFDDHARKHDLKGSPALAKVNLDEVHGVGDRFGISRIPTFMVLVDGERVGVLDKLLGKSTASKDEDTTALLGMAQSLEELARQERNAH